MATNKWIEMYQHDDFKFETLTCNESWAIMMKHIIANDKKGKIKALEEFLNYSIKRDVTIYPWPNEVFNAFQLDIKNVKVVILGQDPYIKEENDVPQAMGLSFSVKEGIDIPPSLDNIYKNLVKFGHISSKPKHGNLTKWVEQGCLLLNTALTVTAGMSNSHKDYWIYLTNAMIQYISDNTTGVVFMLWGGSALGKLPLIDQEKHNVTMSSHPSPMSVKSTLKGHDCFENTNHFGITNNYLISNGMDPIDWSL